MSVAADAEFCQHCGAKVGPHKHVPWWHLHRRLYDWTLAWAHRPSAAVALFVLSFAESSFFPVPPDVLLMPLVLGNRRRWLAYAFLCSLASVMGAVFGYFIGWYLWQIPFDRLGLLLGLLLGGPLSWAVFRKRKRVLTFSLTALGAALMGAIFFAVGHWLWDGTTANLFFRLVPGFTPEVFDRVSGLYETYNFWIVFTAGFTPIPFKVITVTAGIFGTGPQVEHPGVFFGVFMLAAAISRSARFFLVAGLMRAFGPKITPFVDKYFNWLSLLFVALLAGGFVALKYFGH
ncbi:MAG: YqaA family protein [Planctomycetota bacterium]|jgi:membrane protein YqaA with SNARE-associated domain